MVYRLRETKIKKRDFLDALNATTNAPKDKIIVFDAINGREYSNLKFSQSANALADFLAKNASEQIVVCEQNSVELAILYFAAMLANKIVVPIDPEKQASEIAKIAQIHGGATMLNPGELGKIIFKFELERYSARLDFSRVDFEKPFLITYTSGSTGSPKGAIHSAGNLFAAAFAFGKLMGYDASLKMAHCMPMTYMAGILNTLLTPYLWGGAIILTPRFSVQNAPFFGKRRKNTAQTRYGYRPLCLEF